MQAMGVKFSRCNNSLILGMLGAERFWLGFVGRIYSGNVLGENVTIVGRGGVTTGGRGEVITTGDGSWGGGEVFAVTDAAGCSGAVADKRTGLG